MYAVVKTGGKQLKVAVGETVSVEKLDAAPGDVVTLTALLVNDGEKVLVGKDVASIAITAEVLGHGKADKVMVFKFKKRKGYKKTRGHRQQLTLIKITDIAIVAGKPAKAETKAEKAPAKAEKAPAAKKPAAAKKAPAAKAAAPKPDKAAAEKKPAAKKAPAKKPAAVKTDKPAE